MVMPVNQRCPACGAWFVGSDAIGDTCPTCQGIPTMETMQANVIIALQQELDRVRAENVAIPDHLRQLFRRSSFCPDNLVRGREETDIAWSTLRVEPYAATENEYGGALMYYDLHYRGEVGRATKAFADWSTEADAEFVKSVVEWFQTMTAARLMRSE